MTAHAVSSLIVLASLALAGCAADAGGDEPTAKGESALTTLAAPEDRANLPEERLVNGHGIENRVLKARLDTLDVEEGAAAARYRAPLVNKEDSPLDQGLAVPRIGEVDVDQSPAATLNPRQSSGLAERVANGGDGDGVVTFGATLVQTDAFVANEIAPRYALAVPR